MKKQILFLMIIWILFSCNKNDDGINLETEIIGNWKLIQMTGSIPNSETIGSEMEWVLLFLDHIAYHVYRNVIF